MGVVDCVGSHGFRTCVLVVREGGVWEECLATIGLVGGLVVTERVNIDILQNDFPSQLMITHL